MNLNSKEVVVCVVGVGYVGLPLARAFSASLKTIAFDIDEEKVCSLSRQSTPPTPVFTANHEEIRVADFIVICVPTPVKQSKEPDLSYITKAASIVGQNMKKGAVVILESTVYPGATEEIVIPILEKESELTCGRDFKIGYSPERINPGDTDHTLEHITKVIAGMDRETTDLMADLYTRVAGTVFKAKNIKTAEAAKVIENIQRDLNIALANELALIFEKLGLNTQDVFDAAATKWNFHRYTPGLVGGHCIPVDPYYLVYKAKELGHHPQVILAGRAINDHMPKHVAEMCIKTLNDVGKVIKDSRVVIAGLAYKKNVADIRETPAKRVAEELKEYGIQILGFDPLLEERPASFALEFVDNIWSLDKIDCVIVLVAHDAFGNMTIPRIRGIMNDKPILIDVANLYQRDEAEKEGFYYRTL